MPGMPSSAICAPRDRGDVLGDDAVLAVPVSSRYQRSGVVPSSGASCWLRRRRRRRRSAVAVDLAACTSAAPSGRRRRLALDAGGEDDAVAVEDLAAHAPAARRSRRACRTPPPGTVAASKRLDPHQLGGEDGEDEQAARAGTGRGGAGSRRGRRDAGGAGSTRCHALRGVTGGGRTGLRCGGTASSRRGVRPAQRHGRRCARSLSVGVTGSPVTASGLVRRTGGGCRRRWPPGPVRGRRWRVRGGGATGRCVDDVKALVGLRRLRHADDRAVGEPEEGHALGRHHAQLLGLRRPGCAGERRSSTAPG